MTRWLIGTMTLLFAAYVAGFIAFADALPRVPTHLDRPDGIVVLTGGDSRLDAAGALFERGVGKRLLITGVNTETSRKAIRLLMHGGARFDCCVDLGRDAANTLGNAQEAAEWAHRHRYKRLLIVTASYHMPRSLNEFAAAMPGIRLEPYPVDPESVNLRRWWRSPAAIRVLAFEYPKYLASLVLTHAVSRDERGALDPGAASRQSRHAASDRAAAAHRS